MEEIKMKRELMEDCHVLIPAMNDVELCKLEKTIQEIIVMMLQRGVNIQQK